MDSVLFGNAEDLALIYQCQLFAVQLDGLTSAVADENGVAHLDFHRDTSALGRKLAFAAGNDLALCGNACRILGCQYQTACGLFFLFFFYFNQYSVCQRFHCHDPFLL